MIDLSVVIPTYNRAKRLRACLDALSVQTQATSDFEVIVVIDGSTDETVEILKNFDAPFLLRTVFQKNSGQPSALNNGINQAKGRYCLFIDDDIVADPRLVTEHLRTQHQHPKVVVVGQITLSLPVNAGWYTRAFAQGWRDHYDQLNQGTIPITWEDCYSGNMSAPREALLACGGFALNLVRGYDVELAKRLENQGCSLVYRPNALGCQDEQKGFWELSQDAEKAGKVDVMLYSQDPQLLSQALASFSQDSWRKLLLRRLLLALNIQPKFLELLGRLIRNPARKQSWYGITQTFCYWRGVRDIAVKKGIWRQLTSGTPILMYHAMGLPTESAGPFVMPPKRFAAQMEWLKRTGYHPITLEQFLDCQRDRRFPPARSVVVTFDDGYADNHTYAYPVLRQHNIPITIFLVSGGVGFTNHWDTGGQLSGRPLMSWSQIQDMAAQGVQFGAHSKTHPALTAVSTIRAKEEISGSRRELEEKLGGAVTLFAYPYGEYNPVIQALVQETGCTASCTVNPGLNTLITPCFSLRRAEVQGTDSLIRFFLVLWLGDGEAFWWRRNQDHTAS